MFTTVLWWLMFPFALIVAVALWASESQQQRIVRLHRSGMSQAAIATKLATTRYKVRKALSAAA